MLSNHEADSLKRWSASDESVLRQAILNGKSAKEMVSIFPDKSRAMLQGKIGFMRKELFGKPAKKNRKAWSTAETQTLKTLAAQGLTPEAIAEKMNRSHQTIRRKAKYFGIAFCHPGKREYWTAADIEKLRVCTEKGMLDSEIANALGRSATAVEHKRTKMNLRKPYKTSIFEPDTLAQVIKFKMAGWSHERIGKAFGVGVARISNILLRYEFYRFGDCWYHPHGRQIKYWTEIEIHRLRKLCKRHYKKGFTERDWRYIAYQFPNRTLHAVQKKACRLMRYWETPEQIAETARREQEFYAKVYHYLTPDQRAEHVEKLRRKPLRVY